MGMAEMTCECGAVYEIVKTEGPTRTEENFKCVLCEKELFSWAGSNVAQFRLVKQRKLDRE